MTFVHHNPPPPYRYYSAKLAGQIIKPKQRKRNRKPLLPKNYDPNAKPDPERWLPKRERSAFLNAKRKGKGKEKFKGPQGVNMEGGGIGGTGSAQIK